MMRLANFITKNNKQIAAEWEKFAATLLPDEEFSRSVLRDDIDEILKEIATDMERPQSGPQQHAKSEGDSPNQFFEAVAERHALGRFRMGVSSRQLMSEFRALRASVIQLWRRGSMEVDETALYDLTRFNE